MEAPMSAQLYNTQILRLAAHIPHQGLLADTGVRPEVVDGSAGDPTGSACGREVDTLTNVTQARVTKVSPICGSKITVDVVVEDGRVAAFGQEVRACALGQASASILGEAILGASLEELQATRAALADFLAGSGDAPQGRFEALEIFRPAIPHRGRHGSILLAFQAAEEAATHANRMR